MYLSTVIAFVVLPFLVGAVPISPNSSRTKGPISIPLSKRLNYLDHDGRVDHEILKAGERHTKARFEQALNVYERNTGKRHPFALKQGHSNKRRNTTPVTLTDHSNVMWTGDIKVGTPPTAFSVQFDTVLPDMFLFGTSPACQCNGRQVYDITSSSTGTNLQSTALLKFGENSVDGNVVSDTVVLGGFAAVNQTMVIATSVDPAFQCQGFSAEGIVGLGLKEASRFGKDSVFGTLLNNRGPNGLLATGGFAFAFSFAKSGPELSLGGADSSKFTGNLAFFNVYTPGFWQILLDSFSVNGNNIKVAQEVILDTSSVFISGDLETISNIYSNIPSSAQIPDSNQWTIPCDTTVTITASFGGNTFNIAPSSYILGPVPSDGPLAKLCVGGLAVAPSESSWMMGTVFLQNVYTFFDQSTMQVGLAPSSDT